MEVMETMKKKEILKKIYESKSEEIDKLIQKINKETREELKSINMERAIEESKNPRELREIFNIIEDNYNIKITRYNEEMYKLGFIDGINLMIECLKK